MNEVLLRDVAHCRAGDKGSDSLLVLAPYDPGLLDHLVQSLPAQALASHFGNLPVDQVRIVVAPGLGAIAITLVDRLGGGVTRATSIDPHGKTLSGHLLSMRIPWPAG